MPLSEEAALLKRVATELLRLIDHAEGGTTPPEPPEPPVPPEPPAQATIAFEPADLGTLKEKVAGQGVKVALTVKTTGMAAFDWTVVRGREPWGWHTYPPIRVATTGSVRIEPTFFENGDFVKVLKADDAAVSKDSARVVLEPATPTMPPVGGGTINILVRGQSNALLFCDFGGAGVLRDTLRAALGGRGVNCLYAWTNTNGDNSINSGSEFLTWDSDGKQQGLLRFVAALPANQKTAPFLTVWMHNESDQKMNPDTGHWVSEVRKDTSLVRGALGLSPAQSPVCFTPVRYNWGDIRSIRAGMDQLVADKSFNAWLSMAAWGARMDYEPDKPNMEHMSRNDANMIGRTLGQELAAYFR